METSGNRDKAGRFVKGVCGNPGGRPKLPADFKAALEQLVPRALEVLERAIDESEQTGKLTTQTIQAATYIINRAYGKPPESIRVTGEEEPTEVVIKFLPPTRAGDQYGPVVRTIEERVLGGDALEEDT
jgi:hypothetical protein